MKIRNACRNVHAHCDKLCLFFFQYILDTSLSAHMYSCTQGGNYGMYGVTFRKIQTFTK